MLAFPFLFQEDGGRERGIVAWRGVGSGCVWVCFDVVGCVWVCLCVGVVVVVVLGGAGGWGRVEVEVSKGRVSSLAETFWDPGRLFSHV